MRVLKQSEKEIYKNEKNRVDFGGSNEGKTKGQRTSPKFICRPKGGWKPSTWYLCEVACSANNPVHFNLLFTGFLDSNNEPSGYSGFIAANYAPSEAAEQYNRPYLISVYAEVFEEKCRSGGMTGDFIKRMTNDVAVCDKNSNNDKGKVICEFDNLNER